MQGDAGERSGKRPFDRRGVAINASEDRERLLTRGVKNIMGVARDRREREKTDRKLQDRRLACSCHNDAPVP